MAWTQPPEEWARRRRLVVRLIAQHELTSEQIAKVADVSRQSVFHYRDIVVKSGAAGLLKRAKAPGNRLAVRGAVRVEFVRRLEAGQFWQARDVQAWIKNRTRRSLSGSGVRKGRRRLRGKLKVPRKSHAKKDPAKAVQFKAELPANLSAVVGPAPAQPVRLCMLDEHRYALLPVIGRVWGVRGHTPYATKYKWRYLHEALEVDGAHASELLFTPANSPVSRQWPANDLCHKPSPCRCLSKTPFAPPSIPNARSKSPGRSMPTPPCSPSALAFARSTSPARASPITRMESPTSVTRL